MGKNSYEFIFYSVSWGHLEIFLPLKMIISLKNKIMKTTGRLTLKVVIVL